MTPISFNPFYRLIAEGPLSHWLETLPAQLAHWQHTVCSNPFKDWCNTVERLPTLVASNIDIINKVSASIQPPLTEGQRQGLETRLKMLMPWRKGPYDLYGIHLDTEWHSDWKWQRVLPHISPLKGKYVLDVGCGNGYHLWRILGEGASFAVGIDPIPLFLCQFEAIRKLLGNNQQAHLLPLTIEALPNSQAFDSVFSMGVLYHRRSPLDHLYQLKNQLVSGGELILETLTIEGDHYQVLVPGERYAQMSNVYFIPSVNALVSWLTKCGFVDVQLADISVTTTEEQRRTQWMTNDSLAEFLDPNDPSKTIEGYPAPKRAILVAKKP